MYVNPIEILGLSNATETSSIDNETIKKAKRRLFADIDLSDDGLFKYYGLKLTKSDCEKVIDELSNNDIKEFYLYLTSNKKLNDFLANGNNEIFKSFKQDCIFKLPEFIQFISPYFASKFDKALLIAFENENEIDMKAILNTSSLVAPNDVNTAYKSISTNIHDRISEIDEMTKDIENEESVYDENDIEDVVSLVKTHFPTNTLNCLPQYFQSQILKIAKSINYLSNSIWDAFDTTQVPNDLTEYLLTLNIEGLERPTFENNFKIIKKKNDERIEQAKNAPLLKIWANVLLQLRKYIKEVEDKSLASNSAYEETKNLLEINELNCLPGFADEIRNQIAYSIRSLSISIWNKQSDIKNAINTLNIALQINVKNDDRDKFKQDLVDLQELEKKYRGVLICHFCEKNTPDEKAGFTKRIYLETFSYTHGRSTSVHYRSSDVFIPRCDNCKISHSIGWGIYIAVLLLSLFSLLWFTHSQDFLNGYVFIGIFIISWLISKVVIILFYHKQGRKFNTELILKTHPLIKDKIEMDWSFSQPSASNIDSMFSLFIATYDFADKITTAFIQKIIKPKNLQEMNKNKKCKK